MRKNLLITGAGGYLGQRLCEFLNASGQYNLFLQTRNKNLISSLNLKDAYLINEDFSAIQDFSAIVRNIDYIVHLSCTDAHESLLSPEKAIDINIKQAFKLFYSANQFQVKKIIYFSTIHVYGDNLSGQVDEDFIPKPKSVYAITHKAAEDFLISLAQSGKFCPFIFRLSNAFGLPALPIQASEMTWNLLVNNIIKQACTNYKMLFKSCSDKIVNVIPIAFVNYITNFFLQNIQEINSSPIYNVCSNRNITLLELSKIIEDNLGRLINKSIQSVFPNNNHNDNYFFYSSDKLNQYGLYKDFNSNFNQEIYKMFSFFLNDIKYTEDK